MTRLPSHQTRENLAVAERARIVALDLDPGPPRYYLLLEKGERTAAAHDEAGDLLLFAHEHYAAHWLTQQRPGIEVQVTVGTTPAYHALLALEALRDRPDSIGAMQPSELAQLWSLSNELARELRDEAREIIERTAP